MRVLLVTGLVAGGIGRHVEMLVHGLAAAGHRVSVACPAPVSRRFDLGASVDLPVGSRPHPVHDVVALRTLRALALEADVVHAHGLRAGALAVLARRGPGGPGRRRPGRAPVVVTTHNAPPRGPAAATVYVLMERLVARRADLVLGVSPDLLERARRAGARRTALAVVPAAPAARVDREAARAALQEELSLEPARPLVVSVGRLAAQKQTGALLRAMAHLGAHLQDADTRRPTLLVAGEGPERSALLQHLARPGIRAVVDARLLGRRDDVPVLLAAADVVVSAARWEGQPVWLQEALAQGAAVVATDVGGTAAVLGGAGLLVPPASGREGSEQLARAIATVLDDPGLREGLRARALVRAAQLPTEDDALAATLAAYASVR